MTYDIRFMRFFLAILIFFLTFGWLTLLFSATGLFYAAMLILSILVSAALAFYFLLYISKNIEEKPGKLFYFVIVISLFAALATCHFSTPTVFGGRDQGSIAAAAVYLSQNHNLKVDLPVAHDLFQKYGAGKALNFPGFDYTKNGDLVSRFPPGYTAYLASAYDFSGLKGLQYANFIPLFFFLVIFWLILKEIFPEKISFLGYLLAATFFPFLWFAKYSLTEIYMLFLVWTGIYFLIKFRRCPTPTSREGVGHLVAAFGFFALSALVRIEGIIFFLLAAIYILILQRKNILPKIKSFNKYFLISTLLLFLVYIYLNFPDLLDSLKNFMKIFLPNSGKESAPSANLYAYLARIFFNYNIASYLVLGLAGIVWLATRVKKNWNKPEYLPVLLTFPAFFYLLSPVITLDDPWLLRRFVFAVFPALIFYAIYFLQKFFYHKIFLYLTLAVLIAANGVVSWRFFTLSENKELLSQIEKISQKFGPDDLILVDPPATGSGFSLMSEPLRTIYGKNAVYFFNAGDLKYVNQDRYKNIYLIASAMQENPWYASLTKDNPPVATQVITNNFLEPSDQKYALAQNVEAKSLVLIWKVK